MKHLFLIFLVLFNFSACATLKKNNNISETKSINHIDTLMRKLHSPTNWNDLLMKGPVRLLLNGVNYAADATLACKNDSLICISIKALGIEALRIWLNMDSIVCLNRLEKSVTAVSYETINREWNILLDYSLVQAWLINSYALPPLLVYDFSSDSLHYTLYGISEAMECIALFNKNNLSPIKFKIQAGKSTIETNILQTKEINHSQLAISTTSRLALENKLNAAWQLQWKTVEKKPSSLYKLSIPSHYKRIELKSYDN